MSNPTNPNIVRQRRQYTEQQDFLGGVKRSGEDIVSGAGPSEGEAIADNSELYDTIQAAVDAASHSVRVGPGTFSESVTVATSGLDIRGVGRPTLIDGGVDGEGISITASDVTVKDLSAKTTAGGGNNNAAIVSTAVDTTVSDVWIRDSDYVGLWFNTGAARSRSVGVKVESADEWGIVTNDEQIEISDFFILDVAKDDGAGLSALAGDECSFSDGRIYQSNDKGLRCAASGDMFVDGVSVIAPADDGMQINDDNTLVSNCFIKNAGSEGIDLNGTDQVVHGCRIFGSSASNIDTAGATTPTTADNVLG